MKPHDLSSLAWVSIVQELWTVAKKHLILLCSLHHIQNANDANQNDANSGFVWVNDAFPDQTDRKTLMLLEMSPKENCGRNQNSLKHLLKLTQNQKT